MNADRLERLCAALAERYRIVREIGSGGMATVYLAHDVRHDRDVALKLLKPELGAVLGTERFLSEIRVTAKLQHPNLLPLFDSGECEGQLYYVMPFVPGESLRVRLDRDRQLPVEEAVRLSSAVASALDYAHRHGIIHRDLKPENILLHDGQPLVADFGIALAVSNAGGERVTQTGLSLGTPQYMSPEQATGERTIDQRADVYSLGAVTYEMLAGEPPHTGATVQAVIARVLTETPRRLRLNRPAVPAHVDSAVAKALEKVPADRFDSAKDFANVLEGKKSIASAEALHGARIEGTSGSPWRALAGPKTAWAIAAVAALAAIVIGATWRRDKSGSLERGAEPVAFVIPRGAARTEPGAASLAISPNGQYIAYVDADSATTRLYLRSLRELDARPIPGTEGAESPFFSPDSRYLAFFARGELKRLQLGQNLPSTILDNITPRQPWWASPSRIIVPSIALTRRRSGLSEISVSTGAVKTLLSSDTLKQENLMFPVVVDDDALLFGSQGRGGFEDDFLAIGALDDPEYTVTEFLTSKPLGYVDGHAILLNWEGGRGTIVALPVNLRTRRVTGEPVILRETIGSSAGATMSTTGTLIHEVGAGASQLVWDTGKGTTTTAIPDAMEYATPRLSPDGRKIAFMVPGTLTTDVWLYHIPGKTLSKFSAGSGGRPEWTPDGKSLVYIRATTASAGIWIQPTDGSGPATRIDLKPPAGVSAPYSAIMSPDGQRILFVAFAAAQRRDIFYLEHGRDEPRTWLSTSADEYAPNFSADGKWLAYTSDESGIAEIYARPFPGPGPRVQISSGGGTEPRWSHDGRRLFYRQGWQLIEASIERGEELTVRSRRAVTALPSPPIGGTTTYDVSRDGTRFLYPRPTGGDTKIVVVVNWLTEVRERLAESRR